jgi:hypothetical protein
MALCVAAGTGFFRSGGLSCCRGVWAIWLVTRGLERPIVVTVAHCRKRTLTDNRRLDLTQVDMTKGPDAVDPGAVDHVLV